MARQNLVTTASVVMLSAALAAMPAIVRAAEASTSEAGTEVGEVVVTAQRREESLQKVPVAVTAITAQALSRSSTVSTVDLPAIAPGLTITQSSSASQPFIRGVGAQAVSVGYEGSVATYVDGVYIASLLASIFSFNNVERVEVLRGPQGTLFGRNTTGGLIQVITRKPTYEPTVDMGVTAESYSTFTGNFYGSTRLADNVAANVAIYAHNQGEGFGKNLLLNEDINYNNEYAVRGQLLLEPAANVKVLLGADYDNSSNDFGVARTLFQNGRNVLGATRTGSPYDHTGTTARHVPGHQWGISQNASLDMGWATLRSITAYRYWALQANYDQDMTPVHIVDVTQNYDTRTVQQEFLLQGGGGPLQWTGGVFYFNSHAVLKPTTTSGLSPATNFSRFGTQDLNSYAVYMQGDYALTEKLKLTGGLRYTNDQRVLNASFIAGPGNASPPGTVLASVVDRKQNVGKSTWKVGATYQASDNFMVYVSASRGFRSGAFNLNAILDPPVNPEILTAVEGGFKADLLDRRLRVNAALFDYDYKDIQLSQTLAGGAFRVLNAAGATVRGGEFEVTAVPPVPTGHLQLSANLSILSAKYDKFPGAPYFLPNPYTTTPAGVTCPLPANPAPGGNSSCNFDASGKNMIRSPKWTAGAFGVYSFPVGSGEVELSANYFHSDGFYWEPDNRTRQAPYDLVNGQISYGPESGNWKIRVFGRNLTNTLYYSAVSESSVGDLSTAFPPRTYGIGLDVKLGAH